MGSFSAEEVLRYLIGILVQNLQEVCDAEKLSPSAFEFGEGLKNAYVECLETIQMWADAKENGLDWDVEARFPV